MVSFESASKYLVGFGILWSLMQALASTYFFGKNYGGVYPNIITKAAAIVVLAVICAIYLRLYFKVKGHAGNTETSNLKSVATEQNTVIANIGRPRYFLEQFSSCCQATQFVICHTLLSTNGHRTTHLLKNGQLLKQ